MVPRAPRHTCKLMFAIGCFVEAAKAEPHLLSLRYLTRLRLLFLVPAVGRYETCFAWTPAWNCSRIPVLPFRFQDRQRGGEKSSYPLEVGLTPDVAAGRSQTAFHLFPI